MTKLTFEEFSANIRGGESRQHPGRACGHVLLDDFYYEWLYATDEIEEEDEQNLLLAYAEYLEVYKTQKNA